MQAERVWDVWRRILRSGAADALPGDDAEARTILDYYREHGERTQWFIDNYRFRMGSSFEHALETGAPLTHRLLRRRGLDVRELAGEFFVHEAWADYGPRVYTLCEAILGYLETHAATREIEGLPDLVRLERGAVRLIRAHAASSPQTWLSAEAAQALAAAVATTPLRANGTGLVVRTEHALSAWIRETARIGTEPLAPGPDWFLISLPSQTAAHRITKIGARAAAFLERLATPETPARARCRDADETSIGTRLARLGVVRAATA